jgi:hypothetical protein
MLKKASTEENRYLVCLVCLVCLVEQGQQDERNKPDEPVLPVSLGYPANNTFLVPTSNRSYCTALMCRPPGVGGGVSGAGGGTTGGRDPGGVKVARLLLLDSLLAES